MQQRVYFRQFNLLPDPTEYSSHMSEYNVCSWEPRQEVLSQKNLHCIDYVLLNAYKLLVSTSLVVASGLDKSMGHTNNSKPLDLYEQGESPRPSTVLGHQHTFEGQMSLHCLSILVSTSLSHLPPLKQNQ